MLSHVYTEIRLFYLHVTVVSSKQEPSSRGSETPFCHVLAKISREHFFLCKYHPFKKMGSVCQEAGQEVSAN